MISFPITAMAPRLIAIDAAMPIDSSDYGARNDSVNALTAKSGKV